jgi:hypothetical protein
MTLSAGLKPRGYEVKGKPFASWAGKIFTDSLPDSLPTA